MDADQTELDEMAEKLRALRDSLGKAECARDHEKGRKERWRGFALLLVIMLFGHCSQLRSRAKAELGLMSIMEEARGELKKVIRDVERMPAAEAARDELVEDLEEVDFILNMERFAIE